jgi:hypothetical protein
MHHDGAGGYWLEARDVGRTDEGSGVRDAGAAAVIPEPYRSAHKDCGPGNDHRTRVLASKNVGCFYCLKIFSPAEIEEWTLDGCALCPHCGIDSVLPESIGLNQ